MDTTPSREERHQQVKDGIRCYDCGELFDTPIPDDESKWAKTDAEWAQQQPNHVSCFQ